MACRLILVLIIASLLIEAGCSPPAAPPPIVPPTAFFDWCTANKFGVKSPESTDIRNVPKNGTSPIGVAELMAWTPSKSDAEAQKLLEELTAELRRVAIQHGVNLADASGPADAKGYRVLFTYQSGRNRGTLEGKCALTDTKTDGKSVQAYFVYYKLTEVIGEGI